MSTSAASPHPSAPHQLPIFLSGSDGSDPFLIGVGIFLLIAVIAFGVFLLWLHHLPEHIAHRSHKVQYQVVAVLGLIAMFTHMHIFWIAGLLLALIELPNITAPLRRIAGASERMAGLPPGSDDTVGTGEDVHHTATEPSHSTAGTGSRQRS